MLPENTEEQIAVSTNRPRSRVVTVPKASFAGSVVVIWPSAEGAGRLSQIAAHLGIPVAAVEASLPEAARIAKEAERQAAVAIMALPRTAAAARQETLLPVVSLEFAAEEIAGAIREAVEKYAARRVALACYPECKAASAFATLAGLLRVHAECLPYASSSEMHATVSHALASKTDVMLTFGPCLAQLAQSAGIPALIIQPSEQTLARALAHAWLTACQSRRVAGYISEDLLDRISLGLLFVGPKDQVVLANRRARELLGFPAGAVRGQDLDQVRQLVSAGHQQAETVENIGGRPLAVWREVIEREPGSKYSFLALREIGEALKPPARAHWQSFVARHQFSDVVGNSEVITTVKQKAITCAKTDWPVLLTGETGVGKELFAQSIHNVSRRTLGPFVAVNCAAIPESLLESELFGYEGGAFTGARREGHAGLLELADGGTIFLDEIGEMAVPLQPKLLRFLDSREIRRVGGSRNIPVDVRVIAATQQDLPKLCRARKFRPDLYFRLSVLHMRIPALRERREDISLLVDHFLRKAAEESGQPVAQLPSTALKALVSYHWPGNVRQLESTIRQYSLFARGLPPEEQEQLLQRILDSWADSEVDQSEESLLSDHLTIRLGSLEDIQIQVIKALRSKNLTHEEIARILGISRTTLWKKLNRPRSS